MEDHQLDQLCDFYMKKFCQEISERSVGSQGNRDATRFFQEILESLNWQTESQEFSAIDWHDGGARLESGDESFHVLVSPYSLSFSGRGMLAEASSLKMLETRNFKDKILLLHGEIAREQLMPKNFMFYNPEEHRKIVSLLEKSKAQALICATGRNAALAGGVYPFPLIEDGDFDLPSVYMTEEEVKKLLPYLDKEVRLESDSQRIKGKGYNVIGKKGGEKQKRIVITAHIDAKKGTPGAIDNASGVSILLLLAQLLKDYSASSALEITAFNGEDYFSVPGQMKYIKENNNDFKDVLLNINIDGAGYREGKSSFSFFNLPEEFQSAANRIIRQYPGIVQGNPWVQGDHSIFLQSDVPAIAVSSQWFLNNIDNQDITHTPKDNLSITDNKKIVEIARALADFITMIG